LKSLAKLHSLTGVPKSSIHEFEHRKRRLTLQYAELLANKFGIDPNLLIDDVNKNHFDK